MCFYSSLTLLLWHSSILRQVRVYPLTQCEHGADDVLVMGTDGLWDVLSNQEVAEAVTCFLANCDPDDQHRHVGSSHSCSRRSETNFLSPPVLFGEDEHCCLVVIMQISKHLDKSSSDVMAKLARRPAWTSDSEFPADKLCAYSQRFTKNACKQFIVCSLAYR